MGKIPPSFFERSNVNTIAKDLLGKCLYTHFDKKITGGFITEVEAYAGGGDRASHAHTGIPSKRTEVMFGPAGRAYVYLCYGIHNMFNVVCNKEGRADAILIRAIEPLTGIEWMLERRKMRTITKRLSCGPGIVCQALGITRSCNGEPLNTNKLWLSELPFRSKRKLDLCRADICASTRIGVDYAGNDALLPWRYTIKGNKWVSR